MNLPKQPSEFRIWLNQMSIEMPDAKWDELWNESRMDLRRAEENLRNADNSQAAYYAQQAIEKVVKAYLYKNEILMIEPKALGHSIINVLFDILLHRTKNLIERKSHTGRFITSGVALTKALQRTKGLLDLLEQRQDELWKMSLGIPIDSMLVAKVQKESKETWRDLQTAFFRFVADSLIDVKALNNLSGEQKYKLVRKLSKVGIEERILRGIILGEEVDFESSKGLPFCLSIVMKWNSINEVSGGRIKLHRSLRRSIMAAYPFQYADIILELSPHQNYAHFRRANMHDGKSTHELYQQHSARVVRLFQDARETHQKITEDLYNQFLD